MKKKQKNFSWMNPKLEVRDTTKYGKGVYAKKMITKGENLAIFGGYVLKVGDEVNDSGIQIEENLVLSGLNNNEPTDYINHSCNPNSGIKGQNFIVSMNNINKNEQITFDYAMCLFSLTKKADYSFKCLCGEKNCRKLITSNDWKILSLQKKYKGYFQWYLQNKINKNAK